MEINEERLLELHTKHEEGSLSPDEYKEYLKLYKAFLESLKTNLLQDKLVYDFTQKEAQN